MPDPVTFEQLVPPWSGWDTPAGMPESEVLARLQEQVDAAKETDGGRHAAIGLAVAVGNYEYLGERREKVMELAASLLNELDPDRSRYWG